ncbi:MAG: hypothetical protein COS72_01855 [Candidatus Moranbacteria bacterium CG06_land_8_20_14_3_00_43_56]|nr:MAG: hypothetical protein COS72_01855 [Candidatus Moranbacteria bacterium CG06_land_8_20_14_3_00_43_56]PIV83390.1 MAG: hypothetical protein COW51_04640 [Candidatus Moranbacteria bacterium CG17_big_fil_post_rev_8_21_14_2_50_44_12]
MKEKVTKSRRIFKAVIFVGLVFVLSGMSLIVIDRYLFPELVSIGWLSKYKIFKKATENVVVVNKTEQVTVSEEQTIFHYSNKSASSVVEILSRKKRETRISGANIVEEPKIGSGLIAAADGLVVTHRSALAGEASEYEVITGEGGKYKARVVLQDPFSDIALLKMEGAENLSTASFIAPEDIRVGAKVVAIGRSESNAQIVFKSGLISSFANNFSVGGPITSSEKLQGVYFADFEVNKESDENLIGSAVADYNGNIIGILGIRKSSSSVQYFIIPVNYIDGLVNQFIEKGVVQRGSLGVYYLLLAKENSIRLADGREIEKGALVYSPGLQQGLAVLSGSAAEKAGIRIMDIILSVNGEEINPSQNLAYLVSKYKPRDGIDLKVVRDSREIEIKAFLQ